MQRDKALKEYLELYQGDIMNPNNLLELYCDLLTSDYNT